MDVLNSILLIIDSEKICNIISSSYKKFKKIYLAKNTDEAKNLLSKNKIDVVIIDFKNINDEINVTKELNSLFIGPIIVVIEDLAEFTVSQLIDLGIDDFIPKDFDFNDFINIIKNSIKKKKIDISLKKISEKLESCRQN